MLSKKTKGGIVTTAPFMAQKMVYLWSTKIPPILQGERASRSWLTTFLQIIAKLIPITFFCVTEMRFSTK